MESSAGRNRTGAQIKVAELGSTALLKLASVVQEPLELLLAKNKHKLSVIDRRVYWWILSKMASLQTTNKEEIVDVPKENLVFEIPIHDLYLQQPNEKESDSKKKWTRGQLTNRITYSAFKVAAEKLIERSIILVDHMDIVDPTKRKVGAIAIFPRVFYENGILEVHVDRLIVPAMCTISKGYTKYQREAAMALGHDYAQILYVRLCRFLDTHMWRVSVDALRAILEASNYSRYSNFKQKVLIPAVQEINEKTDIYVEVNEIISFGKKVTDLCFKIDKRTAIDKHALKRKRQANEMTLKEVYSYDIDVRKRKAIEVLWTEYTFGKKQIEVIVSNEDLLNRFIELHTKIEDGLITVKTSPTRYIAHILFLKLKSDSGLTLF